MSISKKTNSDHFVELKDGRRIEAIQDGSKTVVSLVSRNSRLQLSFHAMWLASPSFPTFWVETANETVMAEIENLEKVKLFSRNFRGKIQSVKIVPTSSAVSSFSCMGCGETATTKNKEWLCEKCKRGDGIDEDVHSALSNEPQAASPSAPNSNQ